MPLWHPNLVYKVVQFAKYGRRAKSREEEVDTRENLSLVFDTIECEETL